MEQILINLVAGALGGAGVGKASPNFDLGTVGNIVSGLVGGGVLGQIVTLALPSVVAAAESGNLSIGGIISQVVAGGAGGAIQDRPKDCSASSSNSMVEGPGADSQREARARDRRRH
jgi:hypothetical protein